MGDLVNFVEWKQQRRLKIARANLRAGAEPDSMFDEDGWPVPVESVVRHTGMGPNPWAVFSRRTQDNA